MGYLLNTYKGVLEGRIISYETILNISQCISFPFCKINEAIVEENIKSTHLMIG